MEVKRDTKEKFHVITVETVDLSANMTEDLSKQLLIILQDNIKNVVLNLKNVKTIDEKSAESIVKTQQIFYEQNASFVICELTADLENFLDKQNLLEIMNVTPTESEAGDIVQMEELERELLDEDSQS